jgi:hypothetical protein
MTAYPLAIGIDTGGTFTDVVLFDLNRRAIRRKGKTPTTHGDYTVCIGLAFEALALTREEIASLQRIALSTTLATNTVAEEKVHPTALVIEPGDVKLPKDFHPHLVLLKSQIGFDTAEVVPVSEAEVLEKVRALSDQVESFAVSCFASTRNPAHEQQIAALLIKHFGKPVVLGSELTHQLNFMQRARAAALNAGLLPVILEWLQAVKRTLATRGIRCPLYIVKGDGSLMEEAEAVQRPVQTLFSGPAASLHGGVFLSEADQAMVVDVGGTTTDIGWVRSGRGVIKLGGIRINDRQIAVDGLDMATYGLAGDSRLRRMGRDRFRFDNHRALPFCRAAERFPGFSLASIEAELSDQWHFGDPELIELAGLDELRLGKGENGTPAPVLTGPQALIVEQLQRGPRRLKALAKAVGESKFTDEFQELIRKRIVVRIALTPTDLFCAEGGTAAFSQEDARRAIAMYAHMVDRPPEEFHDILNQTLARQAAAVLMSFLMGLEPPLSPDSPVMQRLVEMLFAAPNGPVPTLALDPGHPIVMVGAGAPVLYGKAPACLLQRMTVPLDGDVANALGAVTSQFVLRESVSIEPMRYGGVELYDHRGKQYFPSLSDALTEARKRLKASLMERARALSLTDTDFKLDEFVLEDYAEFSRRAHRELVIARVEALLTGMPG